MKSLLQAEKAAYEEAMLIPLWTNPDYQAEDLCLTWDKSVIESPFTRGGHNILRFEYIWFEE